MTEEIRYTKFLNTYDPVSVSWDYQGRTVQVDFPSVISALRSDKLNCVVIEIYEEGKLNFYALTGDLVSSEALPYLQGYQFRGINKNKESKTGISILFNPVDDSVGNKWRDIEQYELTDKPGFRLGRSLGIYR
ncbi:MAG: hypothetical protein QM709_09925 [Spongiibacteraceae bacterium]